MKENKEEVCPNCDVHSHCSLHDPELFEDMMDTPQTPEWEEIAKEIVGKWGYEEEYWWKPIAEALSQAEERGRRRGIEEIAKRVDEVVEEVVEDILIAFTNIDTEKEMREYIREAIKNLIK